MQCIQDNDMVNECIGKMIEADAIIIGTPTYFAGVTPEIKAFMDRAFLVGKANDDMFRQSFRAGCSRAAVRGSLRCGYDQSLFHYQRDVRCWITILE